MSEYLEKPKRIANSLFQLWRELSYYDEHELYCNQATLACVEMLPEYIKVLHQGPLFVGLLLLYTRFYVYVDEQLADGIMVIKGNDEEWTISYE